MGPACTAEIGDPLTAGEDNGDGGGDGNGNGNGNGDVEPVYQPSNIDAERLVASQAEVTLDFPDRVITIDTDTGSIELEAEDGTGEDVVLQFEDLVFVPVPQGDELPDLGVFAAANLNISENTRVDVVGSAALVFALSGSANVAGTIVATGGRDLFSTPGPGGFAGSGNDRDGDGPGGGAYGGDTDTGGGGGGHAAQGGKGGDRNDPLNDNVLVPGGAGGQAYGAGEREPLTGGSGGGRGGDEGGPGGGGGGAVQISALGTITIASSGGINVGGGRGRSSLDDDGGGGGGAGGTILLEAETIDIAGILAANGGGGGGGGNELLAQGNNGESGGLGDTAALGGAKSGEGEAGGNGGAGDSPGGDPGDDATGVELESENAGGGGGAGGRIILRSGERDTPGVISPVAGLETASL